MAQPSFTAGIVVFSQILLQGNEKWQSLVSPTSHEIYQASLCEAASNSITLKMLTLLPCKIALKLLESFTAAGYAQHIALRKQAIDVQVRAEITRGVKQLVIIGAGYDALGTQIAREFSDVTVFELDLPEAQQSKQKALAASGIKIPHNFNFIACDLSKTPLEKVLQEHPKFSAATQTMLVAEGITMYLTRQQNSKWLSGMHALCGDSLRVIFTFIESANVASKYQHRLRDMFLKRSNSSYRFAVPEAEITQILEECGYQQHWIKRYAELQRMYRSEEVYRKLQQQPGEHVVFAQAVTAV